ncbi:hypothetical protein ACFQH6_04325 [Halobacteriaceae archaeon GCM10025711]
MRQEIPDYTVGEASVAESPLTDEGFHLLEQTVMSTEAGEEYRRMAGEVLAGQRDEAVERMYDAWCKSVVCQVAPWTQPYAKEGDF